MVASVNGDEFLKDQTGDRRFWIVDLGRHVIDTHKLSNDRDRIRKAAIAQYRAGRRPCLQRAEQALSDQWKSFRSENIYLSAVEERCLGKLKARSIGFVTCKTLVESGVCEWRPIGQREMRQMAQCLSELGIVQERNATKDHLFGRTRKCRWAGTGTQAPPGKSVSILPLQGMGFERTGTQHSCFGNCAELFLNVNRVFDFLLF